MFDRSIFDLILSSWDTISGNEIPPKPRIEDLKQLFEFIFLLSLRSEEGSGIRVSATLVSKKELLTEKYKLAPADYFIEFDKPVILNSEKATKLCVALDSRTTSIAVERDQQGHQLIAWGLLHNNKPVEGLLHSVQHNYRAPDFLNIVAERPGNLMVHFGDRSIGRFFDGRFEIALPTIFAPGSLGDYFIESIKSHSAAKISHSRYFGLYNDCIRTLFREASFRGHGGTLIWCPEAKLEQALALLETRNTFKNTISLEDDLAEHLHMQNDSKAIPQFLSSNKHRIKSRLELIAQLSVADGAILFTEKFSPISFGSLIKARRWEGEVESGPMLHKNKPVKVDLSRFGTRHNSAANFVGELEGAITFVISEDGPVRAFRRVNNKILFWKDCLTSCFRD